MVKVKQKEDLQVQVPFGTWSLVNSTIKCFCLAFHGFILAGKILTKSAYIA
jgi:hypothetical protein